MAEVARQDLFSPCCVHKMGIGVSPRARTP
jgi:hypothetical protein